MRSHRFINNLLYLIIQLVAKESNAKENNRGIRCFFVLFIDKHYISQVIHFNAFTLTRAPRSMEHSSNCKKIMLQESFQQESAELAKLDGPSVLGNL